ncbi:MAG: hypothetical protein ACYC35_10180 [Pirellulales bacterium]
MPNDQAVPAQSAPVEPLSAPSMGLDFARQFGEMRTPLAGIKEWGVAEKGEVVNQAYTVEEVTGKKKLPKFTVRQACKRPHGLKEKGLAVSAANP